ncbi:acyltransferase [bacterium]|nr:acyltransferase [bacterium]
MEQKKEKEEGSLQKELMEEGKSSFRKYTEIFVGKKSFWKFLKYELILFLFSWVPGALGLFLRKIFYPLIVGEVGKGVVFGHHVTLRHPHKIKVGSYCYIDDYAVLDAKGIQNQGITIGDHAMVGRNTILSCKEGDIELEDYANISARCTLLSETSIKVGKYSFLAGHCYLVAGGNHRFDKTDVPIMFQPPLTKGGIEVGKDCWLGASVTVLDGVKMGEGCVVGAGAVVKDSLSEFSIAVGVPARAIKSRKS